MFTRTTTNLARKCLTATASSTRSRVSPLLSHGVRGIGTLEESKTAKSAWQKSCYFEMDFTIPEDASVYEAVQKFAAYDVGCLVTTDSSGTFHMALDLKISSALYNADNFVVHSKGGVSGVISERDYVSKIALLGRVSKDTKVKEISTKSSNLVTASPKDSVDECMSKMLAKDIRHLPLVDESGKVRS